MEQCLPASRVTSPTSQRPGRNGHFFTRERPEVLRQRAVDRNWNCARAAVADLPANFHFHDLRHTANTITASTGASTAEMHRMGHASSAAALRYQHATRERDVEVPRRLDEFVARRTPGDRSGSARWTLGGCDKSPTGSEPTTRNITGDVHFSVETMGLEPTTPNLQGSTEGGRAVALRDIACPTTTPRSRQKRRSAGVSVVLRVRSCAAPCRAVTNCDEVADLR